MEMGVTLNLPKRLSDPKSRVRRSQKQESEIAGRVGGRTTKASGSGGFEKGDVRITRLARIEAKTTQAASFRVTTDMIDKIEGHALQAGEIPVIEVELSGGARRVAIVPVWALDALLDAAK
jgi:hypothetical protein